MRFGLTLRGDPSLRVSHGSRRCRTPRPAALSFLANSRYRRQLRGHPCDRRGDRRRPMPSNARWRRLIDAQSVSGLCAHRRAHCIRSRRRVPGIHPERGGGAGRARSPRPAVGPLVRHRGGRRDRRARAVWARAASCSAARDRRAIRQLVAAGHAVRRGPYRARAACCMPAR